MSTKEPAFIVIGEHHRCVVVGQPEKPSTEHPRGIPTWYRCEDCGATGSKNTLKKQKKRTCEARSRRPASPFFGAC